MFVFYEYGHYSVTFYGIWKKLSTIGFNVKLPTLWKNQFVTRFCEVSNKRLSKQWLKIYDFGGVSGRLWFDVCIEFEPYGLNKKNFCKTSKTIVIWT